MFNSLRWSLFGWYAAILAAVIAGFGSMLYFSQRRALKHEIDAALKAHLRAIAACIEIDSSGVAAPIVPPEYRRQFEHKGKHASYFAIWDLDGRLLAASRDDLNLPPPARTSAPGPNPEKAWGSDQGEFHELNQVGPGGTIVTVGQSTLEGQARLQQLLGMTVAAGTMSWCVALAGGWFLARRALAPIEGMTSTATAISAGNLDQRIDISQTKNELGRLAGVLNAAFDRLELAYAEQTRFTADASHELRTPLAVLMASTSLALRHERTPEEYRQTLNTNMQAARRMHHLVERMLTLARAEANEAAGVRGPVDLQPLVEEVCTLFQPLVDQQRLQLTTHLAPSTVSATDDELRQIVTNLLANAVRYTPTGGDVDVRLDREGDEAVLRVSDTGVGIAAEDLPHIFERFYRVDKARSRREGGTGLGLSVVQAIVDSLGGTVACTSEQGAGTTFVVRLPLAQSEAAKSA